MLNKPYNHVSNPITFFYREQRKRYHTIRKRAETDTSIMSIILDGMDQSKTHLPHLKVVNKTSANLWKLRTHLTGILPSSYWDNYPD